MRPKTDRNALTSVTRKDDPVFSPYLRMAYEACPAVKATFNNYLFPIMETAAPSGRLKIRIRKNATRPGGKNCIPAAVAVSFSQDGQAGDHTNGACTDVRTYTCRKTAKSRTHGGARPHSASGRNAISFLRITKNRDTTDKWKSICPQRPRRKVLILV